MIDAVLETWRRETPGWLTVVAASVVQDAEKKVPDAAQRPPPPARVSEEPEVMTYSLCSTVKVTSRFQNANHFLERTTLVHVI